MFLCYLAVQRYNFFVENKIFLNFFNISYHRWPLMQKLGTTFLSITHSLPLKGTPSNLEGEFLYSSSPKLGEVAEGRRSVSILYLTSFNFHLNTHFLSPAERVFLIFLKFPNLFCLNLIIKGL